MITGFKRILIDVPDLRAAAAEYAVLLGAFDITGSGDGPDSAGQDSARLGLRNVTIELVQSTRSGASIKGLVLADDSRADEEPRALTGDTRGLFLAASRPRQAAFDDTLTDTGISAVDHVVLMSGDADDCIRLFGEGGLGMRLALDQSVPEWGGRMLFFRSGKLTLEVIQKLEEPPAQDFFWGITYFSPELEKSLERLDTAGVDHSPIREGRKPGTRVATIKSHNLGIPTLLIEPA